jgi:hypothetical protein
MSLAATIACVAIMPSSPGHHLMDVSVGECKTNSSLALSKVAVVSRAYTDGLYQTRLAYSDI